MVYPISDTNLEAGHECHTYTLRHIKTLHILTFLNNIYSLCRSMVTNKMKTPVSIGTTQYKIRTYLSRNPLDTFVIMN